MPRFNIGQNIVYRPVGVSPFNNGIKRLIYIISREDVGCLIGSVTGPLPLSSLSTSRERNAGRQLDSLTAFINSASRDEMPRKCNLGSECPEKRRMKPWKPSRLVLQNDRCRHSNSSQ
ncbi:hypothetical protein TEQG_03953 [Trichophyton equinum CBS 127.97]|uniref:Uncharacterized protein n=1 Tax=Trichophyton equinum (strain ATCC MYA-4606 / CBS 127.97) TaxID=559882 RepID=F2PS24_TRIEC|nr:hypothetical protein TEQG_03953 [Trichophyton equinum CBS 127.97]